MKKQINLLISVAIVGLVILAIPLISDSQIITLQEGDLVKTANSPSLYLIQNGQKKVFPHISVYRSWGLPEDFFTVKTVADLSNYSEGDPVAFRDGSLFRGTTTSLYGRQSSAVFFVSNGKLRPIKSAEVYQELFADSDWEKVSWIPDDLLDRFVYPMGDLIDSSIIHPDGSLIRYKGSSGIYLIANGDKRPITSITIFDKNRLNLSDVIEIEVGEVYSDGVAVQPEEEALTMNIPNVEKATTFVKTYRMYNTNHGWGVWPTEDNHYILTGSVLIGRQDDAFISKVNNQGVPIWAKLIGSWVHYSGPMGTGPVDDAGYLVVQLKDGAYLLAGQTLGYVGDAEAEIFETPVDIFLSKFDQQGKHLWTETVGDLAGDTPTSLWPTDDGGFLLYGTLAELGAGAEYVGDEDHYFFLSKFDKDGQKKWIKKTNLKIGGTMGEQEQVNFFTEQEDNVGFTLTGTIPYDEVLKTEDEEVGCGMNTVVKLDKNRQVVWAKTIEAIPNEYLTAKADGLGGYTESYMKARWSAGNFSAVQRTSDGGYLSIGFLSPFVRGYADYGSTYATITGTPLLAVKLDKDGNYRWAKTITTGLFTFDQEFRIVKTADNDFLIMFNYMSGGTEFIGGKLYDDYMKKAEITSKLYPVNYQPGDEEKNPTLKKAIEEMCKAKDKWAATMIQHTALFKIDSEFNVKWAKTLGPEVKPVNLNKTTGSPYQFTGSNIRLDSDGGILIAGTHYTDIVSFVSFGISFFFEDALLVKLDANGELADNSAGLVSKHYAVAQEDLSQYITTRDVEPRINNYELQIKRQQPRVSSKTVKMYTLAPFKAKAVVPKSQGLLSSVATPITIPIAKTRAEMNYETTATVVLVNEKSREVHQELLPILNQLFNNEVKLRDNFGGISLDYTFKRLVTRDDAVVVQEYLEGIGYTTDSSEGGQVIMMKIGRVLNLLFSISNKRSGTLNVTF